MAAFVMSITRFFLLGVAAGVVLTDQSQTGVSREEQMEAEQGKGQIETPAVVLQLKYDRGELNKIYLAQFNKGNSVWAPSVDARSNLCTDLCHAGLGGEACGATCLDLIPVGLKLALTNASSEAADATDLTSEHGVLFGEPRVDVCPGLCENQLGQPLCTCETSEERTNINWAAVCTAFCVSDNYVLRGCPTCEETSAPPLHLTQFHTSRTLSTADGWASWCNAQCRQGHGGAACNCDRSPL